MGSRRPDPVSIEAELREWSRQVLEPPNPQLGGLAACPFAARAWADGEVAVKETSNILGALSQECSAFADGGSRVVILASYKLPDAYALEAAIDAAHRAHKDLHCMAFHPDHGADDAGLEFLSASDWEPTVDDEFCLVFIQGLCDIVAASDKLQRLHYYANFPDDEFEALVINRKRRLQDAY